MQGKALLIIPYFGEFGPWSSLYFGSLGQQSTLDLLLATNAETDSLPQNVRVLKMDLPEFESFAQERIGSSVTLPTPRHLCDLKPAYGYVFKDYLTGYDYWAFGDEDVLYGDLDRILAPLLDGAVDLVVPDKFKTIGHLTLVRNAPVMNELVFKDPQYMAVLMSHEFWAYDETSWAKEGSAGSFTKTVLEAESKGEISVRWGVPIRGDVPWRGEAIRYDGRALYTHTGEELAYFHWGRAKNKRLTFPAWKDGNRGFAYDRYGFYDPKLFPGYEWGRNTVRSLHKRTAQVARLLLQAGAR